MFTLLFPRNIVQNWLIENKKFIESPQKFISFKYSVKHPEYSNDQEEFEGQLITSLGGKFKLIMGPRTLFSNGEKWISFDRRTNQAIIQKPDSLLFKSLVSKINYNELNKILSLSILNDNVATIYNDSQIIKIKFKDNNIESIFSEQNSLTVKITDIKFVKDFMVLDSLFVFNNSSVMMIDLRE